MHNKLLSVLLLLTFLFFPSGTVSAQDTPTYPVYIVQLGDTLSIIAMRFGVSAVDIINENNITNPDAIAAGTELKIPGLEGISGKLTTQTVQVGENLDSISAQYNLPKDIIVKLNRITSPLELYAGTNLIIPQSENLPVYKPAAFVAPQGTILDIALSTQLNPWVIIKTNSISGDWDLLPGEITYRPDDNNPSTFNPISPNIKKITIDPLPLQQGKTIRFIIDTLSPLTTLEGQIGNSPLHFVGSKENQYVALQGINAMEESGLSQLTLNGTNPEKQTFEISQALLVTPGSYGEDPPLQVDPTTIDPSFTRPEEDQISNLTKQFTPTQYWNGPFLWPTDEPCIKSYFGSRRVYNETLKSFHTGLDLGVCANNLNVYAPAAGIVVYTGQLTIRGNSTVIDHGLGVYSGFWHQKEILVKVGDKVESHQILGLIGDTGRVTGPHLHWEIRVGNEQVNPLDWLENTYP